MGAGQNTGVADVIAAPAPDTAHLRFRLFTGGDLPLLAALNADANVRRHLYGALDEEASRKELETYISMQVERGFTTWAVFDREGGNFVGRAGLKYLDAEQTHLGFGVVFKEEYWRTGYAREATDAIISWAFRHIPELDVLYASVARDRTAGRRALEKEGFTLHREVGNPQGESWAIYALTRQRHAAGHSTTPMNGSSR